MSKDRAHSRAKREREAAIQSAARAEAQARKERRDVRRQSFTSRLPRAHSRPTGVLAQRRRNQLSILFFLLLAVNVLVWVFFPDWAARAGALMVSLLAAPVLHTLMFRKP